MILCVLENSHKKTGRYSDIRFGDFVQGLFCSLFLLLHTQLSPLNRRFHYENDLVLGDYEGDDVGVESVRS